MPEGIGFSGVGNLLHFLVDLYGLGDIGLSQEKRGVNDRQHDDLVREIARHQGRLRAFLRCLWIGPNDVDDLLQEVNALLWEKRAEFRPGSDFWAWAAQIARYKSFNRRRALGREPLIFDDELLEQLANTAEIRLREFEERRQALEACVQGLGFPQRRLLELRYVEGKSIEAMGEQIGRPVGSIKQTLYRIREALQKCIESRMASGFSYE